MRTFSKYGGVRMMRIAILRGLAPAALASIPPAGATERIDLAAPSDKAPVASVAASAQATAGRDVVTVAVDQARIVRLPERTQTVVVGNPMIADITVQKNGILVVTGKGYGVTNMIALDGAGALLAESLIRVQAASESLVTVQRGLDRESYSCTPNCQPSLQLGDANKYFSEIQGQAGQRNTLATQR